ncbi:MAG TPA: right-handed parallel beta-helix repeat-containing protein [Candidatus Eisenbacteria bacterium]
MFTNLTRGRTRLLPAILLSLVVVTPSSARNVRLAPTGKPVDYERVRKALGSLAPGDTLTLMRGTFDWSANLSDSSLVAKQPGGMPIPVPRVVVRGEPAQPGRAGVAGTLLKGAVDDDGRPARPKRGTNAAFRNAPNADGVTIEDLTFDSFENAIVLIQADTLVSATPVDALRNGTRDWTLQRLVVKGGPFGIMANGRHEGLTIRDCEFTMALPPHETKPGPAPREGSFAVAVRPYPPAYPGLPTGVVIENNRTHGPVRERESEIFGGLILTSTNGRLVGNEVTAWGIGMVVEGDSLDVSNNRINDCRIGIVAWSTDRLGTGTSHARIAGNEIRDTRRQATGFLSDFTGTGLFLAGLRDSRIEDNRFKGNAGPDIVFGALPATKSSSGNVLAGNGGTIVLTDASRQSNTISGSQLRVLGNRPNPPIVPDSSYVTTPKKP